MHSGCLIETPISFSSENFTIAVLNQGQPHDIHMCPVHLTLDNLGKERSQHFNQDFGSRTGSVAPSFTLALAHSLLEKRHTTSQKPVVVAHQGPQLCVLPDLQPI